jgi:2-oxoglutarate dehydrogenase E2 component (dihydrolipoamide succinyltransferase)
MKIDIKMPKLGESLTEGTVLKWWKKEGESIKKDETLLEVSTDKVDSEIPSPADGVLVKIIAQEQETVAIDAVMAQLETETADLAEISEAQEPVVQEEKKVTQKKAAKKEKEPAKAAGDGASIEVTMPKMGESLTEGTVLKWWKNPGDQVSKDETLLEISTDKVDSEIPSPVSGILQDILVKENETVEVGHVIARISGTVVDRSPVDKVDQSPIAEDEVVGRSPVDNADQSPTEKDEVVGRSPVDKVDRLPVDNTTTRFYSPLVKNIAHKEGIPLSELEKIPGSGHGNRLTKKDILNYLKEGAVPTAAPLPSGERITIIPMDNVRKKIAEHMRFSLDTSAHVYSVSECDMSRGMDIMQRRREEFQQQEGFKLTITPFILHAVVKSILDFPGINASLQDDKIIQKKDINLGIAVAAPRGLIVPVVKNAEEKSFTGLARAVNDLVIRARDNKLTYQDIEGSTFSVTNYGIFGNILGLPIINQPNVAIMGIGAIKKRPVVIESPAGDSIGIRSMLYISMSYDHRLIDGELGGRFMQRLVEYLENIPQDIL